MSRPAPLPGGINPRMRLIGLGAVGRYAGRPGALLDRSGKARPCPCGAGLARKNLLVCGACLALATTPRSPAPCAARYFAWHPLAGWGSRAVQIAPWVVASVGAPVVAL